MLHRSVGITAICALAAAPSKALVIPAGIPSTDDSLGPSIVSPKQQFIELPCPACAFPSKEINIEDDQANDDLFWIQGGANNVVLDFSISDDGERFQLGGEAIYPPQFDRDAFLLGHHIYVTQTPASASEFDIVSGEARSTQLEVTSSGLKVASEVPASPEGDAIVQIKLQIIGLEGQPIELDEVEIQLLRTSAGELFILRVLAIPHHSFLSLSIPPPISDFEEPNYCGSLPLPLCRFKEMLEAKIDAMRNGRIDPGHPCPGWRGYPPTHIKPYHIDGERPTSYHHGRPHHVRPYHDSHKHPFFHSFARSIIAVLIPVMAGITVGLIVSALGLLAGRLIGWVWIKFARGGRRGHASRALQDDILADEGKILLVEEYVDPLPVYEEAPAYVEVEPQHS